MCLYIVSFLPTSGTYNVVHVNDHYFMKHMATLFLAVFIVVSFLSPRDAIYRLTLHEIFSVVNDIYTYISVRDKLETRVITSE